MLPLWLHVLIATSSSAQSSSISIQTPTSGRIICALTAVLQAAKRPVLAHAVSSLSCAQCRSRLSVAAGALSELWVLLRPASFCANSFKVLFFLPFEFQDAWQELHVMCNSLCLFLRWTVTTDFEGV